MKAWVPLAHEMSSFFQFPRWCAKSFATTFGYNKSTKTGDLHFWDRGVLTQAAMPRGGKKSRKDVICKGKEEENEAYSSNASKPFAQ